MTEQEFRCRFPRASRSTIAANRENYSHPQIPNSKPTKQTRALDADNAPEASSARRPHVSFRLCRTRLLDVDAKYGSIKDLLDGLQIAGAIPGDREDQITLDVHQEKVSHRSEERTVIEMEFP